MTRPPRPKPPEVMEPIYDPETGEVTGWLIPSTGEIVPRSLDNTEDGPLQSEA